MRKACVNVFSAIVFAATIAATATAATPPPNSRRESSQEQLRPEENIKCLECLCNAMGEGSCLPGGGDPVVGLLGPFRISKPYWLDADRPVQPGDNPSLPGAFERCVMEPFCAVRTIRGYMKGAPGLKDCDHDGEVTCKDLTITHLTGRYECKDQKDSRTSEVEMCMKPPKSRRPLSTINPSHVYP